MQSMLVVLLVATLVPLLAIQNTSKLDDPIVGAWHIENPRFLPPCHSFRAVDQLARQANVLVGFENTPRCPPSSRSLIGASASETLTDMSARQAFDHLMALMPMYSWKEMNGIIVVRPKVAWNDPGNPLNLPTNSFEATNEQPDQVLHTALQAVMPSLFFPHEDVPRPDGPITRPVTVSFSGGTMLEALNAIARAHGGLEWQLGYPRSLAVITLSTLEFPGDGVIAPVALPPPPR